jgi:DNA-binding transcriptional regulator YhcF (GntR family)
VIRGKNCYKERKGNFLDEALVQFVEEAKRLHIPKEVLIERFARIYDISGE